MIIKSFLRLNEFIAREKIRIGEISKRLFVIGSMLIEKDLPSIVLNRLKSLH